MYTVLPILSFGTSNVFIIFGDGRLLEAILLRNTSYLMNRDLLEGEFLGKGANSRIYCNWEVASVCSNSNNIVQLWRQILPLRSALVQIGA